MQCPVADCCPLPIVTGVERMDADSLLTLRQMG